MEASVAASEPMASGGGSLTADELRRIAHYDPDTGEFTWLQNRGRVKAGTKARRGWGQYVTMRINGYLYMGHRLAWLYVYGEFPKLFIDHINCDGSDNRLVNLREATLQQNLCNRGAPKNNATGYKGVYQLAPGKYLASIKEDGKSKYLGTFDNPVSAHQAYSAAAHRIHGEFARVS
jgi:hypothetical protein